jgi:hypothetical protein
MGVPRQRHFALFVSQGRRGAPSTSVAIRYGDHKSARKPRRGLSNMVILFPLTSLGQTYDVYQVYDWADHRDVCYQMYITERKVRIVSKPRSCRVGAFTYV